MPALAASFDAGRAFDYGRVLGVEAQRSDFNTTLAPTIDLLRNPFNPRAFETFSEDPLLTGRLGAADVNGVQSVPGVGATVKHYNLNTQEHRRSTVDATVDERTLRELYTAPWGRVMREAHPAAVMCAFTGVNGQPSCQNPAAHRHPQGRSSASAVGHAATTGRISPRWSPPTPAWTWTSPGSAQRRERLRPRQRHQVGRALLAAVQAGQVPQATLDDTARRILRGMIRTGMFELPPTIGDLPVAQHGAFARAAVGGRVGAAQERGADAAPGRRRLRRSPSSGRTPTRRHPRRRQPPREPDYEVSPLDGIRRPPASGR